MGKMLDEAWLRDAVAQVPAEDVLEHTGIVHAVRRVVRDWAREFARARPDVESRKVREPPGGLRLDEVGSFFDAWFEGVVEPDDSGSFTLPALERCASRRFELISQDGARISFNLQYLVQVGATAELLLDHGWPADRIDFERGEFDAVGYDERGAVVMVMEARARVTGPDGLEALLREWMTAGADPEVSPPGDAGRTLRELRRLSRDRPVLVWLVANEVRWPFWAVTSEAGGLELTLAPPPSWPLPPAGSPPSDPPTQQ